MSDVSLSGIWDGEYHLLEPDVHFPSDGARMVIDGWEELEEEDVLSPFESPSREPILRRTGDDRSELDKKRFPLRDTEQAWGSLSVVLGALSRVVEMPRKQYQNINHQNKTVSWSFQADEFLTERL